MQRLCEDLAAERGELVSALADLEAADWDRATPADGWTIRDQVTHLAYIDEVATLALQNPDEFRSRLIAEAQPITGWPDRVAARYRSLPGSVASQWLLTAQTDLIGAFQDVDPKTRLPWFGPEMSAASSLTARIMETWAHGQDVYDTLGLIHQPSDRMRHVAHIGVAARGFSFANRGLDAPSEPIYVELTGPDAQAWTWGPADAANSVRGPAEHFCLVVTQRRHLADTDLRVAGQAAEEWMAIAQAFAGEPGPGRSPLRPH